MTPFVLGIKPTTSRSRSENFANIQTLWSFLVSSATMAAIIGINKELTKITSHDIITYLSILFRCCIVCHIHVRFCKVKELVFAEFSIYSIQAILYTLRCFFFQTLREHEIVDNEKKNNKRIFC